MRLRFAEPADLEPVTRLINAAFQVERFFVDGDRISLDAVRELARKGQFILTEDCQNLAGCVYIELCGDRAYLGLLSVHPGRQRSGVGAHLMQAAEDHCRAAGCRFVDLRIVSLRQELPAFYNRLGYQETGTSPFPADVRTKLPCHFITMSKSLARASQAAG